MLTFKRTNSDDPDFQKLIVELNKSLDGDNSELDTSITELYAKLNVIKQINTVIVGYDDDVPVACGCFRPLNDTSVEVKRMYVVTEKRKMGISSLLLKELEAWMKELDYKEALLETGTNMTPAINLYKKNGFRQTERYGEYADCENSYCMKKVIQ